MTCTNAPELAACPFQERVSPWMQACFGAEISADIVERNHRFLEEALELVQSTGCPAEDAHALVEYVYSRPVGEPAQEVGGVMVTLAALCLAAGMDMHAAGETELARIWTKVEKIRAKQAAKPKGSALPQAWPSTSLTALRAQVETLRNVIGVDLRFQNIGDGYRPPMPVEALIRDLEGYAKCMPSPHRAQNVMAMAAKLIRALSAVSRDDTSEVSDGEQGEQNG